jgi:hypothetical protein
MTRFLDLRTWPVGGPLALQVAVNQGTNIDDYTGLDGRTLAGDVANAHVLVATHGFNVNRKDGVACLSNWEGLLQLPPGWVFVGALWPGDSIWLHGLDYPEEPALADHAGALLGPFLDGLLVGAASVSFASHSLGARLVLETIRNMQRSPRHAVLMAGAIDDDCLSQEFSAEANRIGAISVLASTGDDVLSAAFPLGNLAAGIVDQGHPWYHAALGRTGPAPLASAPASFHGPWQIPDGWRYGHHNYLAVDPAPFPTFPIPTEVPAPGSPVPALDPSGNSVIGWQEAFSAAFASTRLLR